MSGRTGLLFGGMNPLEMAGLPSRAPCSLAASPPNPPSKGPVLPEQARVSVISHPEPRGLQPECPARHFVSLAPRGLPVPPPWLCPIAATSAARARSRRPPGTSFTRRTAVTLHPHHPGPPLTRLRQSPPDAGRPCQNLLEKLKKIWSKDTLKLILWDACPVGEERGHWPRVTWSCSSGIPNAHPWWSTEERSENKKSQVWASWALGAQAGPPQPPGPLWPERSCFAS